MPVSRMRMRPWLEQQIESNSIPGLDWVDNEKTMFSIPWKHAARHGWELDKDASLFKKWAIHTGKYVEGQSSDPKTWKANFRCALNSLPDIEEVKDKSISKGHQAVRIFRMLPSTPKSRDKRSKAKETRMRKKSSGIKMEKDTDDSSDSQSFTDESVVEDALSPQSSTVDSTVNTEIPDFTFMDGAEGPDLSSSVEIQTKSFLDNLVSRFEVSPEHSLDYNSDEDIVTLCQQLEQESCWMLGSSDSLGFPINEECTSPWSQGSESSDDLDHIPQYTTLGSDSKYQDCWGFLQNQSCLL